MRSTVWGMAMSDATVIDLDTVEAWTEAEIMCPPGKRKPFSQRLFDNNDEVARDAVREYFIKNRPLIEPNPDQFGIDLLMKWEGRIILGLEIERRHNWRGPIFPFATLHVPVRKLKYASLGFPAYYVATNEEMTHAIVIPFAQLSGMASVEQENKYVAQGEQFVDVPVVDAQVIVLDPWWEVKRSDDALDGKEGERKRLREAELVARKAELEARKREREERRRATKKAGAEA